MTALLSSTDQDVMERNNNSHHTTTTHIGSMLSAAAAATQEPTMANHLPLFCQEVLQQKVPSNDEDEEDSELFNHHSIATGS
jgi:hypothetical protein